MSKIGRNTPCLCGSGKKYKHCCLVEAERHAYTSTDRELALELVQIVRAGPLAKLMESLEAGYEPIDPDPSLDFERQQLAVVLGREIFEAWAMYDVRLTDGSRPVDVVLTNAGPFSPGVRVFLTSMRNSTMRLYALERVQPGASVTLLDLVVGGKTTVYAPAAARRLQPGSLLAGRVVRPGTLGLPELDMVVPFPPDWRDELTEELRADLEQFRSAHPGEPDDEFFKMKPPWFHTQWRLLVEVSDEPEDFDEPEDILVETTVTEAPAKASSAAP